MPKIQKKENFLTFVAAGDNRALPNLSERDLASELYRKSYQGTTIDQFEKNLGITPKKKVKNLKYKFKVFAPEYKDDLTLLNELMNNPKFNIIQWDKNWTVEGLYRIAVIYAEDLDFKDAEQITKEISEGTSNE